MLQFTPAGRNVLTEFWRGLDASQFSEKFSPQNSYHIKSYKLSLKDLANLSPGAGIDSVTREAAWLCVATANDAPQEQLLYGSVTPVSKAPRPNGQVFAGQLRMTSLSLGPVVDRIYKYALSLKAQEAALTSQFGLTGDYEPRILSIPGLLVTAMWLKSLSQASDWVVPLNTKIPDLPTATAMYTMDNFVRITQPLAVTRLSSEIYG